MRRRKWPKRCRSDNSSCRRPPSGLFSPARAIAVDLRMDPHRRTGDNGEDQHDPGPLPVLARRTLAHGGTASPLEHQYSHRRIDPAGHDRVIRDLRADQSNSLRGQCRTGAGSGTLTRRPCSDGHSFQSQRSARDDRERGRTLCSWRPTVPISIRQGWLFRR